MEVKSGFFLNVAFFSFPFLILPSQACSNRAFSACRDRTWKSTTLKTPSREVSSPDRSRLGLVGRRRSSVSLPKPGEDPLIDDQNEHDINSVAGVLKLYFRGLENPLFPKERFQDFISTMSESQEERKGKKKDC